MLPHITPFLTTFWD